jgi:hypothetical protein
MTISQANNPRPKSPISGKDEKPTDGKPEMKIWVGVGGLVLCLIIGAGIVYWLLFGASPKHSLVKVDPSEQTAGGRQMVRGGYIPRDPRGVNQLKNGESFVRGAIGQILVRQKGGDDKFNFSFVPAALNLPREQMAMIAARSRILQDPQMAKQWQVTPDQIEKLKRVQLGGTLKPSPVERSTINDLWTAYTKASDGQPKQDAQKKLIDKLDEIAKAGVEPAKKIYAARFDEMKQILSAETLAKIFKV